MNSILDDAFKLFHVGIMDDRIDKIVSGFEKINDMMKISFSLTKSQELKIMDQPTLFKRNLIGLCGVDLLMKLIDEINQEILMLEHTYSDD